MTPIHSGAAGAAPVGPVLLAVLAMLSVQSGAAVATFMFDDVGPAGAAWLRLSWAAAILLCLSRPALRGRRKGDLRAAVALGVVSAAMTVSYFQALDHIPLGTATALEFLGPLTLAAFGLRQRRGVVWPLLAGIGVLGLTEPWSGAVDMLGVAFALLAGAFWAGYILLTQRVGDRFAQLDGLALSLVAAALLTTPVVFTLPAGAIDGRVLAVSLGAAVLLPLLPYSLEMVALRKLTTASFGTLMSVEPAIGALIGLILLSQVLAPLQVLGIVLVTIAGLGAARQGTRVGSPGHAVVDAELTPAGPAATPMPTVS